MVLCGCFREPLALSNVTNLHLSRGKSHDQNKPWVINIVVWVRLPMSRPKTNNAYEKMAMSAFLYIQVSPSKYRSSYL